MYINLKDQYVLGTADNCNYILSKGGEKCVYLNPYAAYVLKSVMEYGFNVTINIISQASKKDFESTSKAVNKLLDKLKDYIESDDKTNMDILPADLEILHKSNVLDYPLKKSNKPNKMKIYLTDYCNRRCIYCFAGAKYCDGLENESPFLSVDRFREIIKEAADIGVNNIEISGGDPFVVRNVEEYLKIMIDYFPNEWGTSTKSFISKDKAQSLYSIGLKEIQVSIDSYNEPTVDMMLGVKGSFKEEIETIKNLINAGIKVITKCVITSLNIYEIPDTIHFLSNLGVKQMRFSYYYVSANRHSDKLYATNEQLVWLNEQIPRLFEYMKSKGIAHDLSYATIYDENYKSERVICGGYKGTMCVRYDGEVLFCDSLNHCDHFNSGNLKHHGIMEIWNSSTVDNMCNPDYFKENYKGTQCYDCSMFNNCFFRRCYVRTFQYTGNYFDVDPACPYGDETYIIR